MATTPVSESEIWTIQRDFYQNEGIESWNHKLPFYATSNAFIANAYANIITAYMLECVDREMIPADRPFILFELGAGTGKFTCLLLRRLIELQTENAAVPKVLYWATDFVDKNVQFIREHPSLADYIAQGVLDLAVFDAEKDDSLALLCSNRTVALSPAFLEENPIIVLANYVFDSLPFDVFQIGAGKLQIGTVDYQGNLNALQNNQSVNIAALGEITYHDVSLPYYGDPLIDGVLDHYVQAGVEGNLSLPVGTLKFLKRLVGDVTTPRLLISSDKVFFRNDTGIAATPLEITFHNGAFSTTVNFHALETLFKLQRGDAYHQRTPSDLYTSVFVAGARLADLPATSHAIMDSLGTAGPGDLLNLCKILMGYQPQLNPLQMIAFLNSLQWDAVAFDSCAAALRTALRTANNGLISASVAEKMPRVFLSYYKTPGATDTLANIAMMLQETKSYEQAFHYYQLSLEQFGKNDEVFYNMALCQMNLSHFDAARQLLETTLEVNPDHILAKGWIKHLEDMLDAKRKNGG